MGVTCALPSSFVVVMTPSNIIALDALPASARRPGLAEIDHLDGCHKSNRSGSAAVVSTGAWEMAIGMYKHLLLWYFFFPPRRRTQVRCAWHTTCKHDAVGNRLGSVCAAWGTNIPHPSDQ